ncbi:MAG TPA: insulinase family protein, partial [Gammaproteobacteria bacterium]|nr:insulinase family protein [Gammaproteobacteria bacterium]
GGQRMMPPVNVARREQIFEVWIRTLPNAQAVFALRAAVHELRDLIEGGMTVAEFELTRSFLDKYALHFAETMAERLGYAIDDRFYDVPLPGHLQRAREMLAELTLDDVNTALQRHLRADKLKIAIVTGEPDAIRAELTSGEPSAVVYDTPKAAELLEADRVIATTALDVAPERISVVPVEEVFER